MEISTYISRYSGEESPIADWPSFDLGVMLLKKAVPEMQFLMGVLMFEYGPVECVIMAKPSTPGWLPSVWQNDADEADGGWYVMFNKILAAHDEPWRFRMGSVDGSRDEYLMHLVKYTEDHPELQNFTVLEG